MVISIKEDRREEGKARDPLLFYFFLNYVTLHIMVLGLETPVIQ